MPLHDVDTSTWRPWFESRITYGAGVPLSVTALTDAAAGRVAPTCRVHASRPVTVVVQVWPRWLAVTSTEPPPTRIAVPRTDVWPGGTLGRTSSSPFPSWGSTPSSWCTTGQRTP